MQDSEHSGSVPQQQSDLGIIEYLLTSRQTRTYSTVQRVESLNERDSSRPQTASLYFVSLRLQLWLWLRLRLRLRLWLRLRLQLQLWL